MLWGREVIGIGNYAAVHRNINSQIDSNNQMVLPGLDFLIEHTPGLVNKMVSKYDAMYGRHKHVDVPWKVKFLQMVASTTNPYVYNIEKGTWAAYSGIVTPDEAIRRNRKGQLLTVRTDAMYNGIINGKVITGKMATIQDNIWCEPSILIPRFIIAQFWEIITSILRSGRSVRLDISGATPRRIVVGDMGDVALDGVGGWFYFRDRLMGDTVKCGPHEVDSVHIFVSNGDLREPVINGRYDTLVRLLALYTQKVYNNLEKRSVLKAIYNKVGLTNLGEGYPGYVNALEQANNNQLVQLMQSLPEDYKGYMRKVWGTVQSGPAEKVHTEDLNYHITRGICRLEMIRADGGISRFLATNNPRILQVFYGEKYYNKYESDLPHFKMAIRGDGKAENAVDLPAPIERKGDPVLVRSLFHSAEKGSRTSYYKRVYPNRLISLYYLPVVRNV